MNGLDVLTDILRTITFFLDDKVYGLMPTIYGLFMNLSQIDLLSGEDNPISALISRIYVLLGIFMLFRLAFSLLQYMVDPNSFSDSAKGFGKLVTNSLVSLGLLVLTPWIFSTAMEIQSTIINQNVIPSLVLGSGITSGDAGTSTNSGTVMSADFVQEIAKDTQFMMFGAFYYVNGKVVTECVETPVFGTIGMATNEPCLEALDEGFASEEAIYSSNVQLSSFFKVADENGNVTDNRNFSHFDKLLWWKINGEYVINYIPFISTIAGIYVVFLLITFCVDVAVRILKLAFLQAVAPIAIISYVDPKESLSDSKLSKWFKETGKTYFSLFLRLATIYLILLLISAIANTVLSDGSPIQSSISDSSYTMWVYLFLVIGAFMFAKQVPKMIESIFFPKGNGLGEFSLNPFKMYSSVRDSGFGALAGTAVGAGLGAAASGAAAFSAARDEGAGGLRSLFRGVGGFGSGAVRGGYTGFKSGGKQTVSKSLDVAGRVGRNAALKTNTTLTQRIGAYGRQAIGMQSKKEGLDKQIGYHKAVKEHKDNLENIARGKLSKRSSNWKWVQQERDNLQQAVKEQKDLKFDVKDKEGKVVSSKMVHYGDVDYQKAFNQKMDDFYASEKQMVKTYVDTNGRVMDGVDTKEEDYQVTLEKKAFKNDIKDNKLTYEDEKGNNIIKNLDAPTWDEIDEVGKIAEERAAKIEKSADYQDAKTLEESLHSENRQSFWSKQ